MARFAARPDARSGFARLFATSVVVLAVGGCSPPVPDAASDPGEGTVARVNGVDLYYRVHGLTHEVDAGEGSATPVVLVHGSLADHTYWTLSGQDSLLGAHHRVITYSRRYNHPNRNARAPDHSPMIEAFDLEALLDQLGSGPVHLVGHSYGAYTALVFALENPDRVQSLVLAEPPIISWLPGIAGGEGIYEGFMEGVWEPLAEAFADGGDPAGLDFTARWYFGVPWEEVAPEWQTLFLNNVDEWHALAVSPETFPDLDQARVRALAAPTLLLSGGANSGFNVLVDGHLERLLPNVVRVVIPGASHEMFLDEPEASARAMLEFFARHSLPTGTAAR